jgi:CRP/FNR family cyclic AMP-dependent transcriptional regulator
MAFSPLERIAVFDHDPELLGGLDQRTAAQLRGRLMARRGRIEPGSWRPTFEPDQTQGHLGLLVVEGILLRTLQLGPRECSEVVGPGDLIRPWDPDDPAVAVPGASTWRALLPVTFAELDATFALRVAQWPAITAELLARSTRRARMLAYQATIAHVRRAETRLLLSLWHLAGRWGRVTSDGVRVPAPFTHQMLAQIACLERPTVSAAVSHLTAARLVSRTADGGWLLHGDPPPLERAEAGDESSPSPEQQPAGAQR